MMNLMMKRNSRRHGSMCWYTTACIYVSLATPAASACRIHSTQSQPMFFKHAAFIPTRANNNRNLLDIRTRASKRFSSTSTLHADAESDAQVKEKTKRWINNVVIGLNMCPFAEKTRSQKKLFTTVIRSNDVEEILSVVMYESIVRSDDEGTTVIVCPELNPDNFVAFYNVVAMAEEMLHDQNLEGVIQIAPFHPLFQFGDSSGEDGIDNLTNRAPYPIFHILREEEVSLAVKKLDGDSSKVWERNISLLEDMEDIYGRSETEKIMSGEKVEDLKEILRRIARSEEETNDL